MSWNPEHDTPTGPARAVHRIGLYHRSNRHINPELWAIELRTYRLMRRSGIGRHDANLVTFGRLSVHSGALPFNTAKIVPAPKVEPSRLHLPGGVSGRPDLN